MICLGRVWHSFSSQSSPSNAQLGHVSSITFFAVYLLNQMWAVNVINAHFYPLHITQAQKHDAIQQVSKKQWKKNYNFSPAQWTREMLGTWRGPIHAAAHSMLPLPTLCIPGPKMIHPLSHRAAVLTGRKHREHETLVVCSGKQPRRAVLGISTPPALLFLSFWIFLSPPVLGYFGPASVS